MIIERERVKVIAVYCSPLFLKMWKRVRVISEYLGARYACSGAVRSDDD